MMKNTLEYIILWLLFQSLFGINCQITPYKPQQRIGHTATFINNKLYILGGRLSSNITVGAGTIDFFYLDVSVPFNTQTLSWQDLSSVNIVPMHHGAASVNGGANNNTLFLFGGSNETMELVYTFDPQSNSWKIPNIPTTSGINVIRKAFLTGIIGENGTMYLWGGSSGTIGINIQLQNDMLILNTISLSWEMGTLIGAPS